MADETIQIPTGGLECSSTTQLSSYETHQTGQQYIMVSEPNATTPGTYQSRKMTLEELGNEINTRLIDELENLQRVVNAISSALSNAISSEARNIVINSLSTDMYIVSALREDGGVITDLSGYPLSDGVNYEQAEFQEDTPMQTVGSLSVAGTVKEFAVPINKSVDLYTVDVDGYRKTSESGGLSTMVVIVMSESAYQNLSSRMENTLYLTTEEDIPTLTSDAEPLVVDATVASLPQSLDTYQDDDNVEDYEDIVFLDTAETDLEPQTETMVEQTDDMDDEE